MVIKLTSSSSPSSINPSTNFQFPRLSELYFGVFSMLMSIFTFSTGDVLPLEIILHLHLILSENSICWGLDSSILRFKVRCPKLNVLEEKHSILVRITCWKNPCPWSSLFLFIHPDNWSGYFCSQFLLIHFPLFVSFDPSCSYSTVFWWTGLSFSNAYL